MTMTNPTDFDSIVELLERLSIMPKEMPGIEKIKKAFSDTNWFSKIDPKKVIVVAGTNGKGSTCAILESLLLAAKKNVGFYSSPHLIDTTERIRVNAKQVSKGQFTELYLQNKDLIEKFELTHFEALTLMAADYFFSETWNNKLDFAIFEVGLGGTFDATNAIPHAVSVITSLSLDHTAILGRDLLSIAKNKLGIVQAKNLVVHHQFQEELLSLVNEVKSKTESTWHQSLTIKLKKIKSSELVKPPEYFLQTPWGEAKINLFGERAAENAATALTVFEKLGFNPALALFALNQINWKGRMQRVSWPLLKSALYLSGDHNPAGAESLIKLLKDFKWKKIHLIIGIGKDKEATEMLNIFSKLENSELYLTETPFKGLAIDQYPENFKKLAKSLERDVHVLLDKIAATAGADDLVLVTGSLYLVGEVLRKIAAQK